MDTGENTREVDISRNHGLLHHRNLQRILYLQTKFETRTAFLRVKRDRTVSMPRSFCSCTHYTRMQHGEYAIMYTDTCGKTLLYFIANMNYNSTQEEVAG